MRQDQYERLQRLEERLMEVFLDEADPDKWSGAGIQMAAMDKQTRGDRFWCKRNAAATGALFTRVGDMIGKSQGVGVPVQPPAAAEVDDEADELEREIVSFERQAEGLIRQLQSGSKITRGTVKPRGTT